MVIRQLTLRAVRVRRAAVLLAVCVLASSCALRVPRADVEAAAGVGADSAATSDRATGLPVGSGPPTSGEAAGAATDGPGATDAGAGTGSAGADASAAPGAGGANSGAAAAGPMAATLSPIRLGHVGTYSGLLGAIFAGGQPTAQVWANWVNTHGGLNGHAVEVVTADDGGDPGRNLAIVRDMVENQGVIAFFGNITPLSLNGSRAYLEQQQIPLIGGDLTDIAWYQSPMFFPQGALIDGPVRGSAQLAVQYGGPRVALLYCGEADICFRARDLFQQGAVRAAGGQLAYTAQVSIAQPDFTSECIQLRSNDIDAVVATVDGNSLTRLARACAQQDVQVQYVSFAIALVDSLRSDANLEGLVGATALFPWMLSDGPAADYAQAIATFAPDLNTSGSTAAVWGSGALVQAASRSLPAENPTSADFLEGLYALDGETLGGLAPPLRFRPGQPPAEYSCYYTIALEGGQFVTPSGLSPTC